MIVCVKLITTRIVQMPGAINKFCASFHKKMGAFREKLMVDYFSVSTIVDLLEGARLKCLQCLPS